MTASSGSGTNPPWSTPAWLRGAKAWIRDQLDDLGLRLIEPIEQPHIRPWSTVLKIPTDRGDLFFKAASKDFEYEIALTLELKRRLPDIIPEIMATDRDRGWMIMPDGGDPLRAVIRDNPSLEHWEKLLPIYAGLQIELIGSVDQLLKIGVPDRRLAVFPRLVDQLLSDLEMLRLDEEDGLSSLDRERILSGKVPVLCSRLSEYGIPETLDHGDFHDGNIFVDQSGYVFFDWGDSSITHPFFSLRTAFVSVENTFGFEEDAPVFNRLIEVYLEAWEGYGDRPQLREAFGLARRLWSLGSAVRWASAMAPLDEDQAEQYRHVVPSLLQEYIDTNQDLS